MFPPLPEGRYVAMSGFNQPGPITSERAGRPVGSSDRYQQEPGRVYRLWILDVGGQRHVVDAWYLPTATAQGRAELENVVDSIRFLESP